MKTFIEWLTDILTEDMVGVNLCPQCHNDRAKVTINASGESELHCSKCGTPIEKPTAHRGNLPYTTALLAKKPAA